MKSRGNQVQISKIPLPLEPHRMLLIPQQQVVTTCVKCFLREPCKRLSVQGFYWELVTQAPFAWHVPKPQTPGIKAGIQHKLYCLCNSFGHSEPFL